MQQRTPVVFLLTFCLAAGSAFAQTAPMTDKEKLSYTIGVQLAQTVLRQNMDLDDNALMQGIQDALAKQGLKLTNDQMRDVLMKYHQAEVEKHKQAAAENLKKGEAFLAENKKKEGVVELPGGLQYKVLTEGKGKKPTLNDSITVNYEGKLIDGTVFDSSYQRGQPVTLKLNQVIEGWKQALPLMSVGSKWMLFVPPKLAYGDRSPSQEIGPNSTLIFTVELMSIK
jgi:FKBP-type peptidyl-prolyl cis-trans isomerase FklB